MGAPESHTSQDAALSNLLSAAIGSPDNPPASSAQAAQLSYGSLVEVAQRIELYISRYGRENSATLLLHEAMKALRACASDARDVQALPELNPDLIDILGRPSFTCIRIAQLLRLSGMDIAAKAEAEQATVIHYLLGFYLKHGSQWAEKADEDLEQRRVAAIAAQQNKGGT
ncbi:hypothetical protein [Achromobacter marplatensis]|uniref:hypothetical protein n=1 Tax=Achromobacter marplatensis TaxID=470868 RepID=UPI0028EFD249|nr:hypothetical protein [Achromobacter marplatensis]